MKPNHGIVRVGRVSRWQRWASYSVLAACAVTGTAWFLFIDFANWPPPRLTSLWILHGVTGLMALVVMGMALPTHVVATWRHQRNRRVGGLFLGLFAVLGLTSMLLLYGPEATHDAFHWGHVVLGLLACIAMPWHVLRGRKSVGGPILPMNTTRR